MKKMEGKVVLITGGARGIGYGVAKAFAEEGANIVITGRTASTLVEARENLEADYGIEALFVVADGGDEEAVKNVVKQAAERFGRLDCLVNNAQVSKSGTMLVDHTKEDFDLLIRKRLSVLDQAMNRMRIVSSIQIDVASKSFQTTWPASFL